MTRRRSRTRNALVACMAVAALLAGCGGPGAGGDAGGGGDTVRLEFWGWVPGLEEAVATWNAAHPDIQVDFFRMTGDDGDKIPAAIDAGTAPDIVQMSVHSLPGHVVNDRLTDLSEHVADLAADFTPSTWANVSLGGEGIYGVPQDSGPSALMYRKDIFAEHGIAVPTTWDEYLDAARKLKAADPDTYIAQFSPNEPGLWIETIWQNGGTWNSIDGDAWTVEVNNEASTEVARLWQTLLDEDLVKVVEMWTPEYWAEINAGTIATVHYAAWFPLNLEENAGGLAGKWAIAPSPTFPGSDSAGESGGGALVVPRGTQHGAEAVEFMTWLNNSEEGLGFLIDQGGLFPASVKGFEHPALLTPEDYFGGQVINEVFIEAARKAPDSWTPGPTYDLVQDAITDQFGRVANGEITFAQALDLVQASTVEDLRALGVTVRP